MAVSSVYIDLGEESYSELMPSLAFAAGLGGGVGLGTSVSFLRASSGVDGAGGTGYSATVGIGINLPAKGRIGYAARNLFSHVSPEDGASEKLAITSALGLSWPIGTNGLVTGDATFSDKGDGGVIGLH